MRRGKEVYINGLDHMDKMAATPIYGKNFRKSSSPQPKEPMKLGMQYWGTQVLQGFEEHVAIVLLWFSVACFWCQSFGDVSPYVCSYYFSSVSVAEWPPFV